MRDLQDKKGLDVRFKRSENNSADIMTKNTPREIHDRHTHQVKDGALPLWKEDVKQDGSVTEFTSSQSRISSSVSSSPSSSNNTSTTVKSRTSKQPLESKAGGQSTYTLL
jgi:hypothetical protein